MPKRRRVPVAGWERTNRAVPRRGSQAQLGPVDGAASSEVRQIVPNLEQIAKLVGVVTIILYVVGLLAVNSYLFGLGASDFSLARTRFIYTGVIISAGLALTVLLPALAIMRFAGGRSEDSQSPGHNSGLGSRFWRFDRSLRASVLFLIPFVIFVLLQILRVNAPPLDQDEALNMVLKAVVVYFFGICVGGSILATADALGKGGPRLLGIQLPIVTPAVGIIVFGLLSVTQFTSIAYPAIPDQYGGGRPIEVRLLLDKDFTEQAAAIGIPVVGNLSGPVQLAYQGEKTYIIQLDSRHAAQLSSDLVQGVIRVSIEEPTLES